MKAVTFVDLLGFGDLTLNPPRQSFSLDGLHPPDPISRIFDFEELFARHLDKLEAPAFRPSQLMLFSDCAFIVHDEVWRAAFWSTVLMRDCLTLHMPIRMGLAVGTWNPIRFSFDQRHNISITRALFYGTGVVGAHRAEKGGKGCRIFLEESCSEELSRESMFRNRILVTPEGAATSRTELSFLHADDAYIVGDGDDRDAQLVGHVQGMLDSLDLSVPDVVRRQYTETIAAINRMRVQLGRPPIAATKPLAPSLPRHD